MKCLMIFPTYRKLLGRTAILRVMLCTNPMDEESIPSSGMVRGKVRTGGRLGELDGLPPESGLPSSA